MNMDSMKVNDSGEDIFLTAGEISSWLRIPLNTIYRLTKNGNIKGVKVGKQWRYNKNDFSKYITGETGLRNITTERFKERRAYPRMNCNFKCASKVHIDEMKDYCICNGHILNISAGGVLLVTKKDCVYDYTNIGDPIDLDFDLASDIDETLHKINAKGRIVWKRNDGMGIKFRHIDDKYKDLITQYVD